MLRVWFDQVTHVDYYLEGVEVYMFNTCYLGWNHVVDMHSAFIILCMEVSSRSYGPTVSVQ